MIITEREMGDGAQHVFCFNEEALGRENIKLAIVDVNDDLSFVHPDDIIISRTFERQLIETIKSKKVRNTAECYSVYKLVNDKVALSDFLHNHGILVPEVYSMAELEDGHTYFVKPRFGHDSFGIGIDSICRSKDDVTNQIVLTRTYLHQDCIIEDFIDGEEITVSCVNKGGIVHVYAIKVDCSQSGGIQTYYSKDKFKEYCSALHDDKLDEISRNIFSLLGLKHHARFDFRKGKDGHYYLIDINLLPGLGPLAHYSKCLLLSGNISYIDVMKSIVNSATFD